MDDLEKTPIFRETLTQRLRRWVLGAAYALRPNRISLLPRIWWLTLRYLLAPEATRDRLPEHPHVYGAGGLVGISDDLSVPALVANYSRGFFPFCHIWPMKWWCPEDRAVLDPAETHVARNVRRLLRRHRFTVTMDQDFAGVMRACARPRPGKVPLTWITPRLMQAYWDLHKAGYAHSVEVWDEAGNLAGGLYGVAIGKVYFGESQFSRQEHASKVAVAALHRHLAAWGYRLCDAKWMTPHLARFGFKPMAREQFLSLLQWYLDEPSPAARWHVDLTMDLAKPAEQPVERERAPLKVA